MEVKGHGWNVWKSNMQLLEFWKEDLQWEKAIFKEMVANTFPELIKFSDSGIPLNPKNNENVTYSRTHCPESTQHQLVKKKLRAVREKDRAL